MNDLIRIITQNGTSWIQNQEGLPQSAIDWAKLFATSLATDDVGRDSQKKMSTSQLRKFFGELKKIQAAGFTNSKTSFLMLKPQIAYAVGRDFNERHNPKTKIGSFYKAFGFLIDDQKVLQKDHFKNFVHLLEAVVAYHKVAEHESELNKNNNRYGN